MKRTKKCLIVLAGLASVIANFGCESLSSVRETEAHSSPLPSTQPVPESIPREAETPVLETTEIVQASTNETKKSGDEQANIDLLHVLELAGAENPTINLAREAVNEAEAQQSNADALKYPSLDAGFNFRVHRGNLQASPGYILNVNSQSLYFGAGAYTTGAQTVAIPGLRFVYPLADIISEPQAAQQKVVTRRADAASVENVTLLDAATAYFELLQVASRTNALRQSEKEFEDIVRLTKAFAKAGQGRVADANRASANAQLIHRQLLDSEGELAAASARLARLLNLDPGQKLMPPTGPLTPLILIDPLAEIATLQSQAEANRPEVQAGTSEIAESMVRLKQEQMRPWLPTITAGFSLGGFGGGSNLASTELSNFGARTDFDVTACWTFQNLGFGNRALQNRNQAVVFQATSRLQDTRNRIQAEVIEAYTQVQAARTQIETARRQLVTAEEGYLAERKRIEQGEGLPLEVLDSTRSLLESRQQLALAITDFNIAQFRLLTAIGTSPACVDLRMK